MYFVANRGVRMLEIALAGPVYPAWASGAYPAGTIVSDGATNYRARYDTTYYQAVQPSLYGWLWESVGASANRILYATTLEFLPTVPTWTSGEAAYVGDLRVYSGSMYVCILERLTGNTTAPPSASTYWLGKGTVSSAAVAFWAAGLTKTVGALHFDPNDNHLYRIASTSVSNTVRPSLTRTYWDDLGVWRRTSEYGEWISGVAIARGESRYDPATNRDYYCTGGLAAAANTVRPSTMVLSADPTTAAVWYDRGLAAAFRPFDQVTLTQIATPQPVLTFTVQPQSAIYTYDAIGVFAIDGAKTITLTIRAAGGGSILYTNTQTLEYSSGSENTKSAVVWDNFGAMAGTTEATIMLAMTDWYRSAGGTVGVGTIVLGLKAQTGLMLADPAVRMQDFSVIKDDEFGATTLVRRGFSRVVEGDVMIATSAIDNARRWMERLRASPVVWNLNEGTSHESLLLYGLVEAFTPKISAEEQSLLTLRIRGLTE